MGSTVSTRTCWRCTRPVPDGASMCRYCNTAIPVQTQRAQTSSIDDGPRWMSAGPAAPTRTTPAPAKDRATVPAPSLAKVAAREPAPFADNPAFDVWPERATADPVVGFGSAPTTAGGSTSGEATGPPRPMRGAAAAVAVLFGVELLALLVNAFARFQEAGIAADVARDPRSVPLDRITANADLVETSAWSSVGLAGLALVALMAFLYRATVNARTWDTTASHAPHMAIAGYFIPFANLVLPWLVVRQALVVGARRARRPAGAWLVVVWALCQTVGFVARAVFGVQYDALTRDVVPDLETARTTMQGLAGSSALLAVAVGVGIVTVLRIAAIHDTRADA
jgi:hypothetical protein